MSGTRTLPYDVLDGRYRLESLIGRGGMAAVYRATDTRLDRPVAIKILGDTPAADDRRFRSEVRTLARFSHPNLVRVLDAGEVEDRLYLVMDLIDGPTLADRLRDGPLEREEVARIGAGIAAALAYVHGHGIVHRDVKPGNILLDSTGSAYLADFGISRLLDTTGMTTTGQLIGTPAYLAPEQVHGDDVTPAADVYALGLVLLECLQGERAFSGTPSEVAAARMVKGPRIPATLGPRWVTLLAAMTATEPARRMPVDQVSGTLGPWAHGAPISPVRPGTGADGPADAETVIAAAGEAPTRVRTVGVAGAAPGGGRAAAGARTAEPQRRQVALALLAAAIALLIGLGLGAALLGGGSGKRQALAAQRTVTSNRTQTVTQPHTTTVRTTVTRHVRTPVNTLPTAAGQFVTRLAAGEAAGSVSPQAVQQLLAQLDPLLQGGQGNQQIAQFDQLAQVLDIETATGQVTGSSASSLKQSISTLASVLGTSVPPAPSTSQLGPGQGGGPGHGQGHGNGQGH